MHVNMWRKWLVITYYTRYLPWNFINIDVIQWNIFFSYSNHFDITYEIQYFANTLNVKAWVYQL